MCATFALGHGYRMMHVLGLQYVDDPTTTTREDSYFVWLVVHHDCNPLEDSLNPWKFYVSSRYHDVHGDFHDFEPFTDRVVCPDDWLDLSIEVKDYGQNTILRVGDLSTGQSYEKRVTSYVGTLSLPIRIAVQYRHDERSRTDFVDLRLTQNDCGRLTDAGDTFSTAMSFGAGSCEGTLKAGLDTEDWFKFFACCSQSILVSLYSPQSGVVVELYDPGGTRHDCVSTPCFWLAQWGDGEYRIRLSSASWSGTYNFALSFPAPPPGGGCGGCYRNCCPMGPILFVENATKTD